MAFTRSRALLVALIVVAVAGLLPFVDVMPGTSKGFLPSYVTTLFLVNVLTAVLLAQQYLDRGAPHLLGLTLTYVFAAASLLVYAAAMPGLLSDQGLFHSRSLSAWMWQAQHLLVSIGFAAALTGRPRRLLFRGANRTPRARGRLLLRATGLILVGVALLTVGLGALQTYVPTMVVDGDYSRLSHSVGRVVAAAAAVVVLLAVRHTRRDEPERWLLVAAVAILGETLLSTVAGVRFSLGWYAARLLAVGAAATVLVALLAEVGAMHRRLRVVHERLRQEARRDPLTGLLSRTTILQLADEALAAAAADGQPVAFALLDLDHFKAVNDRHGHLAGDAVLRGVGDVLLEHLRTEDSAGRYGGEELLLVLRGADERMAVQAAQRFLGALRAWRPAGAASAVHGVTASIGVHVVHPRSAGDLGDVIAAADRALYAAKAAGRDAVRSSADAPAPAPAPEVLLSR